MQINAQAVATSNERVDNIAKLTIAAGVAISVLEVAGIPAFSITLVGAGCLFVAWVAKRQWTMLAAQPLPLPNAGLQIPDEDLRHAMLAREKAVDIRLNAAHRRISRFVYDALLYSMNAANTTDPHKLYAVASKAYQDLNPPFTLFHDLVLEVVIKWCVQHRCIPSPLPESWLEYADMLGQLQQNMAVTSDLQNVTAHVSRAAEDVSALFEDVSDDVSAPSEPVSDDVSEVSGLSNVVQLSSVPEAFPLLLAMSDLKAELGDKSPAAYALYDHWCQNLSAELLRVRNGREWVKTKDKTLTVRQADVLLKIFKLRALKDGLLVPNPDYTGKPPHPEYLVKSDCPDLILLQK